MEAELVIRDANEADAEAVQAIYAHHVLNGTASYDIEPPSVDHIRDKIRQIRGAGWPFVIGELEGEVAGYAYATAYRARSAYRHSVEDSVYVAQGMHGHGIGKALLHEVIRRCTDSGFTQMVAVVGNSANMGSQRLHEKLGFDRVGVLRDVGFKFGQWVDTVLMQRALR